MENFQRDQAVQFIEGYLRGLQGVYIKGPDLYAEYKDIFCVFENMLGYHEFIRLVGKMAKLSGKKISKIRRKDGCQYKMRTSDFTMAAPDL